MAGTENPANTESLGDFILRNMEPILQDWEDFAGSLFVGEKPGSVVLRNDAKAILKGVVEDISSSQTPEAQENKSKGLAPNNSPAIKNAGELHAIQRLAKQFGLRQVIGEFRALRASVLRRWANENPSGAGRPAEMTRFNEAIVEVLTASPSHYSGKIDESRNVIIGILAHELRNPLNSASSSARVILQSDTADAQCIKAAARILSSVSRMAALARDLLDYARTRLGDELPITIEGTNVGELCAQSVDEVEAAHPGRAITTRFSGRPGGEMGPATNRATINQPAYQCPDPRRSRRCGVGDGHGSCGHGFDRGAQRGPAHSGRRTRVAVRAALSRDQPPVAARTRGVIRSRAGPLHRATDRARPWRRHRCDFHSRVRNDF